MSSKKRTLFLVTSLQRNNMKHAIRRNEWGSLIKQWWVEKIQKMRKKEKKTSTPGEIGMVFFSFFDLGRKKKEVIQISHFFFFQFFSHFFFLSPPLSSTTVYSFLTTACCYGISLKRHDRKKRIFSWNSQCMLYLKLF